MRGILEFIKKYREKLLNDASIDVNPSQDPFMDYRQRISFFVSYTEFAPGITQVGGNFITPVLKLDAEDLKYLYNKYYAKLQDERDERVANLDKEYSLVIPDDNASESSEKRS